MVYNVMGNDYFDPTAGVIDRDYRGNIGVVLFNLSKSDYNVKRGDRIAQLILERIYTPTVVEVQVKGILTTFHCIECK